MAPGTFAGMHSQPHPPAHREVGGYRLLDVLGSGGMGTVYRALDGDDHEVALKLLHPGIAADPSARDRLRREIATLHRVRGPHVARVLDAEADSADAFVVTELVDGQTLDASVREHGPFDEVELADLADGLADALEAIHRVGVVHRDLKPGNVMLTDDGPVVIDFGISQLADDSRLTQTGLVTGTPGYVDPAVMRGAAPGTIGDWWGWAAVLLFAISGQAPFGRGPLQAVLTRVEAGRPETDGVPEPIEPILRQALHPDPQRRLPQQDVRRGLGEFALGRTPTVMIESDPTTVAPPPAETRPAPVSIPPVRRSARQSPPASSPSDAAPRRDRSEDSPPTWVQSATRQQPPMTQNAPPPHSYPPPAHAWAGSQPDEQWRQAQVTPDRTGASVVPSRALQPGVGGQRDLGAHRDFSPQRDLGAQYGTEALPRWARLPRSRPAVVASWLGAIVCVGLLRPVLALAGFVVVLVIAGALGVGADTLRTRRLAVGPRRSDAARTVFSSPWYLISGLLLALPGLIVGLLAAVVIWGLAASRFDHSLVVVAALGSLIVLAWWIPSSSSARRGTRTLLAAIAPNANAARVWAALGFGVAVVAIIAVVAFGAAMVWDPAPAPPVPSF